MSQVLIPKKKYFHQETEKESSETLSYVCHLIISGSSCQETSKLGKADILSGPIDPTHKDEVG